LEWGFADRAPQQIDFVIWTGDSARHDNDINIPRTDSQIYMLNRRIVEGMMGVFGKSDNLGDDDPTNDLVVPVYVFPGRHLWDAVLLTFLAVFQLLETTTSFPTTS
jgi:hypothetical protein